MLSQFRRSSISTFNIVLVKQTPLVFMDVLSRAKQRMNKMARSYGARSCRAKKIKMYTVRILRSPIVLVTTRLFFLAIMVILLSLPWLVPLARSDYSSSTAVYGPDSDSTIIKSYLKILPTLCQDLIDEGLIKKGHKGLIVGAGANVIDDDYVSLLKDNGVDLMTTEDDSDQEKKTMIENHVFDFVFALSFNGIKMIDGVVKNGGMAISPLSNNPLSTNELHSLNNYKIVYLRVFKTTVVALRKAGISYIQPEAKTKCTFTVMRDLKSLYLEHQIIAKLNHQP